VIDTVHNRRGAVFRLLAARGFSSRPARGAQRAFEGSLRCTKGDVRVKLTIMDWNFLSYPSIHLEDRPAFLPELMPHIDVCDDLCYFSPGAVTLDRYDPAMAISQCLDQATSVLNRIAAEPNYRNDDIQDEFPAHWIFGQRTLPFEVLLGQIEDGVESATYFFMNVAGKRRAVIASDMEEASRLETTFGSVKLIKSVGKCWLFKTAVRPFVPTKMPQTVKELFEWLKQWDRKIAAEVQLVLARPDYLKTKFVSFAVHSPVGWLGFGFDLDQMKRIGYRRNPQMYRQFLHRSGGDQPLLRLSIQEVGSRFVHSRNLSFCDLYNKRVTIIGCGAIGSFIAQSIVRLGAGTGSIGVLKLIDPDLLGPENLGRHLLGYPALLHPKAEALMEELKRQFPHSKIEALTKSAFDDPSLFGAELIIDATGEEAVSEYLNELSLSRKARVPVLHVWIKGNGEAVQALWTENNSHACYRCLLVPDASQHRKERLPLLKKEPERRTMGCRAFTPYAVSAPMHTAALATDMVCAWLQGNPSPTFRTRSLETADVFALKNQNLSKIKGCPACDPH